MPKTILDDLISLEGAEPCHVMWVCLHMGLFTLSMAMLLALFHFILQPVNCEKLANYLSILDCIEVFLEIVADRIWGSTFRWIVITCVVIAK